MRERERYMTLEGMRERSKKEAVEAGERRNKCNVTVLQFSAPCPSL